MSGLHYCAKLTPTQLLVVARSLRVANLARSGLPFNGNPPFNGSCGWSHALEMSIPGPCVGESREWAAEREHCRSNMALCGLMQAAGKKRCGSILDVYLANGCFSEEILLKRNFAYFVWVYLRTLSRHSRLDVLRSIAGVLGGVYTLSKKIRFWRLLLDAGIYNH